MVLLPFFPSRASFLTGEMDFGRVGPRASGVGMRASRYPGRVGMEASRSGASRQRANGGLVDNG